MAERFQLPTVITASTWETVVESLWEQSKRGVAQDDDGIEAPVWTNREALAIVTGMRELGRGVTDGFPLWYQFAAICYGWQPESDTIVATQEQADRLYPPDAAVQLSMELRRLAQGLEADRHEDPRIALVDIFDQRTFQAEVVTALSQDGAKAQFKIPIPACKDPRTGRPAKPVKNPQTGKWECPGGIITVDDPFTAIVKIAGPVALILIALGLVYGNLIEKTRRGRRR